MFGTSGIRGTVGETVTGDLALRLGRAVGSATETATVVVGRDPRTTSPLLQDALTAGLRETGVDVIDVGVAATPTIARSVPWQDADLGITVTASHNPPTDNGFKLWDATGKAIGADLQATLTDALDADTPTLAAWDDVGSQTTWDDAKARHLDALTAAVSLTHPVSVVVDVGNGAGSITADALRELGCDVTTLNAQPDGHFPGRDSEPTADTLTGLMTQVANSDAELGIAHDGDADRMLAVDNTGSFVPGDELLALFGQQIAGQGDVVAAPVNTSLLVDDALDTVGAAVTRTRVGDGYVADATQADNVVFGGEPSGAWIWPTETRCPDGPLAAVALTALVADHGPLAAQRATLNQYPLRRDSIHTDNKASVFDHITATVTDRYSDVQTLDGVRVETDDGWFLIRPSGTQPLIRITVEARTTDAATTLFETATDLVHTAINTTTTN